MACQPHSPDTSKIQRSNKKRQTINNNRLLSRSSKSHLLRVRHSKPAQKVVATSTQTAPTSDSTKTGVSKTTNKLVIRAGMRLTSSAKLTGLNLWLSPDPNLLSLSSRDCGIRLSAAFTSHSKSRNKESTTNRHNSSLCTYNSNSRSRLPTAVDKLLSNNRCCNK